MKVPELPQGSVVMVDSNGKNKLAAVIRGKLSKRFVGRKAGPKLMIEMKKATAQILSNLFSCGVLRVVMPMPDPKLGVTKDIAVRVERIVSALYGAHVASQPVNWRRPQ